jgi:GNAT superfamily N-acetyltransferase
MTVRRATADDAAELVALRRVMFAALVPDDDGEWTTLCEVVLRERLASDTAFTAYVVDDPDQAGRLLSCALGSYAPRLPSPGSNAAHVGRVLAVSTRPGHRRRGYARACVAALMGWLTAHGCAHVDSRSSADGQALYAGLGFQPVPDVHMSWRPGTGER